MLLVDTSVWVFHLQEGNVDLNRLLNNGDVICHPLIIGELACGNLNKRSEILSLLRSLPSAIEAEHEEVIQFIEKNHLMGRGLGYIDVHLLASAILASVPIWTFDKKLDKVSAELGIGFDGKFFR
ncbi:MAG: PIN domain-containing protein [Candidatus Sumerlaeota bacterium]|nr:PIN domain-containing protein [Candidatus Sumerlaeota bacterium]